ncbi:protein serine/threonine phosphatase 2C [Amylostereum chailletii]|nr:protein serine/threonine phosphatase 2C [Amylostereum chailletii]
MALSTPAPAPYAEVQVELAERPDDSPLKVSFEPLSEADVDARLVALARPSTTVFDASHGRGADAVSFQPCRTYKSQDRYVVKQLDVYGKKWTFTGVFDGHLGDATVEHTAYHLPIIVTEFLEKTLAGPSSPTPPPEIVSELLSRSITSFDDAIAGDVLDLFPGGLPSLATRSDEEIRRVINDFDGTGVNYKKARLCMYGTTALVALVDPEWKNLWIAGLGDCEAVLVSSTPDGRWHSEVVTNIHNGENKAEIRRVQREHPREPECILNGRVLGTIAPFRCIGDTPFKQPAEFTRRILYNLYPGVPDTTLWENFLSRNHTPPYISSVPEVVHRRLGAPLTSVAGAPSHKIPYFLILTTDGLSELFEEFSRQERADDWAACVGSALQSSSQTHGSASSENLALRLLRMALGGDDTDQVSQLLTLNMGTPWMDDTTIVVQTL